MFDVSRGGADAGAEDSLDFAGYEYLDRLLELTGDEYFGEHMWSTR